VAGGDKLALFGYFARRGQTVNLRQLRYFVGVIDAGNMTRAADQLHVAQTALGMQIKLIEDELGVALLLRHSRGVKATEAGKLLYERALQILKLVEDTRRDVAAVESDSSEAIRLGITPALMAAIGTEIALTVREQMPEVFLSMVEAMSHVLTGILERGEADFVLGYDIPDQPQFVRTPLMQDDLFLATQPNGNDQPTIEFSQAIGSDLAMPEAGDAVRNAVLRAAKDLGYELRVAYEVRSVSAMKSLVLRGAASSILPLFSVADEVGAGSIAARRIVSPAVSRTLYLASLRQRASFRHSDGLTATIREALRGMVERLVPVARQPWARIL
jgi:LysR family nitrogen assimilation transcriptional regulator